MVGERVKRIEYMCQICGKKEVKHPNFGRPKPDKCSKNRITGTHVWEENRIMS